jgi:hypothetical protein
MLVKEMALALENSKASIKKKVLLEMEIALW